MRVGNRLTAASLALAAGVPLAHVGKLLGHKNWATTAKYGHLDDEAGRAAAEAVSTAIERARAGTKGAKGAKSHLRISNGA